MRNIEDEKLKKYPPFFDTYAAAHDLYFDKNTKSWEHFIVINKAMIDGSMRKFTLRKDVHNFEEVLLK